MPRPCFHKLIIPSTIQARQLRIPENFIRKIRDDLSAVAKLAIPDGHVWHVGLKKHNNRYCFQDGWSEFVDRYSIRVGYLLVFRYEGNSAFSVFIFNLIPSEINYQSAALTCSQGTNYYNHNHVFDEMEDDDLVEQMPSSNPSANSGSLRNKLLGERGNQLISNKLGNPLPQNLLNGSKLKNCVNWNDEWNLHLSRAGGNNLPADLQSSREIGVPFSVTDSKRSVDKVRSHALDDDLRKIKLSGKKKRKFASDQGQHSSTQNEEEGDMGFRFYESASVRKRTVTAEERERIVNAAKTFEPANPFCRVVLRPSYLYKGCIMYLPSCFAEKNLSGVAGFIKLQIYNGRQWPVRCRYNGGGGAKLSQGWYEFCLENNLGEGDVCVFESLRTSEIILKVTMFRVSADNGPINPPHPLQPSVGQFRLIRS